MLASPVIIYENPNYGGSNMTLGYGGASNIGTRGFPNDALSSLKVAPFTQVKLYDDSVYKGATITINGPATIPDLGSYQGGKLNNAVTSLIVTRLEPTIDTKVACCTGANGTGQCGEFVPGTPGCDAVMKLFCTADNMGNPICRTWCQNHTDICDVPMFAYCDAHADDPFCACIKSPANTKGIINPKCADAKCMTGGYLTTNMSRTACPNIVDCSVQAGLQNNGVSIGSGTSIVQNCGQSTDTGSATVTPLNTIPVIPPDALAAGAAGANSPFSLSMIFLFKFVLLIAVGVGVYALNMSDAPTLVSKSRPTVKRPAPK